MIRKTLSRTKEATFAIELPNPDYNGMPVPMGTGFFVSPEGWFVTAAHVITETNQPDGPPRTDFDQWWLRKEARPGEFASVYTGISLSWVDPPTDFALLRVSLEANAKKESLRGKAGFPYVEISYRSLDEGEPVYAFGYPLPLVSYFDKTPVRTIGHVSLCPRTTSAVISSNIESTKMIATAGDVQAYVLDKALNYGNSGGPVVATETGRVHAICSRFQSMLVPQEHLTDQQGRKLLISIPSLYGVVTSLANPSIIEKLREVDVRLSDE